MGKKEAKVVNIKDIESVTLTESVRVRRLITKSRENSDKIMFGVVFVEPSNKPIEWKYNIEDEVYFILKGKVTIYCDDRKIEAKEGDAIYLPAGEKHKLINEEIETATIAYALSPPIQ